MTDSFEHKKGDIYIITGRYYNSEKRFRNTTDNPFHAMCFLLWNGSVWQVRDGKRKLVKRVYN